MLKKRYLIVLFLIIIIASISHVSAGDITETSDAITQTTDDEINIGADISEDENALTTDENTNNLKDTPTKTFTQLEAEITGTTNQHLYLEGNYVFNPETDMYGCIEISKSIAIHGKNNIISGNNKNNIFGISEGVDVVIDNVTFIGANIPESEYDGGVVFNEGRLALTNCNFMYNNVAGNGSAIYNSKFLAILNTTFAYNNATTGGAIYNDEGGEINLRYCSFLGNTATDGGAIYNNAGAELYFSDSYLFYNSASGWGGAINNMGTIITHNLTFLNNTAKYGGAIFNYGMLKIMQNYFENNTAYAGAGILNLNELSVEMDTIFKSNRADTTGGAIYTDYLAGIYDCTFTANQAGAAGSAIFNPNQRVAYADNCTFTLNTGDGEVYDCIVSNSEFNLDNMYKGVAINCTTLFGTLNSLNSTGFELKVESVEISSDSGPNKLKILVNIISKPGNEKMNGIGLILNIANKSFFAISKNGTATFELSGFGYDIYDYTIYLNNDRISANRISSSVKFGVDPKIIASDAKVTYSANPYYSITVYGRDGKVASGESVVIKINGKAYATLKTDANGVAKFKITQIPGTYKIIITALKTSITKSITVKHAVTLKKVTVKKSAQKLVLTATLSKVNGKYLKSKKITFKFNGKKYTAKTNKKGIAKVTIKKNVLKKLKVGKKVTYQATYLKDTVKKSVKVKK